MITSMTMTKKRQSSDIQQDKSDILSLLKAVERIYHLCQDVLNIHTQTSLMQSLAIESQMLLFKLRVMRERWHYHLPFKEACSVKLGEWSRRIGKMASGFAETANDSDEAISEYCPSKHFLLDLQAILPENVGKEGYVPYYQETDTKNYIVNQECIRKLIAKDWPSHYKQCFSDYAATEIERAHGISLQSLRDGGEAIRAACHEILTDLSEELSLLNEQQEPDIQPDQFARLADRVFAESDYGGRQARDSARRYVKAWRNRTPQHRLDKSRNDEIEAAKRVIKEQKYGRLVSDYIGDDLDIRGHSEGVGQFLHHVRRDIMPTELYILIEQLFRIQFFLDNKDQQKKALASKNAEALTPVTQPYAENKSDKSPQRPELPYFFKEALSGNSKVTKLFYDILHQTERYMYGKLPEEENSKISFRLYKRWKWNHLRVAFEKCSFIAKETPKQHFAEFVHQVFPNLKTESVIRSIQRYDSKSYDFDRIVRDVVKEFESVTEMMKM